MAAVQCLSVCHSVCYSRVLYWNGLRYQLVPFHFTPHLLGHMPFLPSSSGHACCDRNESERYRPTICRHCQWRRQDFEPGGTVSVFTKADRNCINFYINRINWKTEMTRYTTAFYAICNWKCCKRKYTGFMEHQRWCLQKQYYFFGPRFQELSDVSVVAGDNKINALNAAIAAAI